jgi:hypothetical protein
VNIYTDSKYAFATLHGAIHKGRGLLGKEIKNKENPPIAESHLGTVSSGHHALQRPPKGHK